ncbi:hypothetical protein [Psychrobacter sp. C 20.9]|uniref:hypothetical protein n=1 Tax=Psychrobacter sp. C 20.9 TaxID=1926477 RepID=UPI000B0CAF38|nr:hypothetical protein [Psychrobacter sp. C 20.9]
MSNSNQAGWEWSQEDERRWHAEQELAATRQPIDQSVTDRMLADFDSIFMNEGE